MDDISPVTTASRRLVRLAVAALLLAAPACTRQDQGAGTELPKVALSSLATGEPAQWPAGGRPLVINLWASWCTPCRAEMPAFEQVHQQLGDRVDIVGVTDEDDHDGSVEAARDAGVTYPLLRDDDQALLTDLEVSGLPATVFVDAEGTVVGRHLGALTAAELTKEIEDRYGITA